MRGLAMNLVLEFAPKKRVILTEAAVVKLRAHVQTSFSTPEAGGALLGRHLCESDDIVVDEVTIPQKQDRRSRFSFFRSSRHSDVAMVRWKESRGRVAYLGLWHTHPEPFPTPSQTDLTDWKNAIRKDSFEGEKLFFVIVGTEEVGVWIGSRNFEIRKLTPQYEAKI